MAGPDRWVASNEYLEIALSDATRGGLQSFVDRATGRDFVARPAPLYRLTLSRPGHSPLELSSLDADGLSVQAERSDAGLLLTLTYQGHHSLALDVTCRLWLKADSPLSEWGLGVRNNTPYGVRAIHYPVVLAPPVLGETDADDCLVSGYFGGRLIRRPYENLKTSPLGHEVWWCRARQYPGLMSAQLQAYYDDTAGLYLATHDGQGCVKAFNVTLAGEALDLTVEHNYDETPGLSFDLPYETVLGTFHGDWYAAADLYKAWARHQPWCARKTIERDDVPDWIKEPRPWLCVISRGNYDRLRGYVCSPPSEYPIPKYWPAKNAVPRIRTYASLLDTPVVAWMEGWEKIGAPGGPVDIFPPLEGEARFKAAMAELHRDGSQVFMYLAFPWCYKRPMVGYDGWERFEREGRPLATLDEHGQLNKHLFPNAQKYFVSLCMGSSGTRQLYLQNLLRLLDLGAVALQIDQQLGLMADVCYGDEHDHPPGYGRWMALKELEFLERSREAIKARNPDATFSYEEPCEIWIQHVDIHMHRPYSLGCIPLFDYLYAEYALRYGGDGMSGHAHPEEELIKHAMIFAWGIQPMVGICQPEYDYEVNPDFPGFALLRNTLQAQRTYAREYLVFGEMLRPTELEVSQLRIDLWKPCGENDNRDPGTVEVSAVMHSVWRSPRGSLGHVLVNWTGQPEPVRLVLADPGRPAAVVTAEGRETVPEAWRQDGTVRLTVPARGVLLVEQG